MRVVWVGSTMAPGAVEASAATTIGRPTDRSWLHLRVRGRQPPRRPDGLAHPAGDLRLLMTLFLSHSANHFHHEHRVVLMDRAGWHVANDLAEPNSMTVLPPPPYGPECNPPSRSRSTLTPTTCATSPRHARRCRRCPQRRPPLPPNQPTPRSLHDRLRSDHHSTFDIEAVLDVALLQSSRGFRVQRGDGLESRLLSLGLAELIYELPQAIRQQTVNPMTWSRDMVICLKNRSSQGFYVLRLRLAEELGDDGLELGVDRLPTEQDRMELAGDVLEPGDDLLQGSG